MKLKCFLFGHDIAIKNKCINNFAYGILFGISTIFGYLGVGAYGASFFTVDGEIPPSVLLAFMFCWIIAVVATLHIAGTKTYLFSEHYVDGICVRCEKMFFDATRQTTKILHQDKIRQAKLEKFNKLSRLRSKALGSSGGGS